MRARLLHADSMWVSALYMRGSEPAVASRIKDEGDDLLIQEASGGRTLERVPFEHLTKLEHECSVIVLALTWGREEAKLHVTDLPTLRASPWGWRVPGGAKKKVAHDRLLNVGLVAITLTLIFLAALPWLFPALPPSTEASLFSHRRVVPVSAICETPAGRAAVDKLLGSLSLDSAVPFEVEFVRGSDIDAFATLGGRVFIRKGLLDQLQTPIELATVIAHQYEHVRLRHVTSALSEGAPLHFLFGELPGGIWNDMDPALTDFVAQTHFDSALEKQATQAETELLARASFPPGTLNDVRARLQTKGVYPTFLWNHDELAQADRGLANVSSLPKPPSAPLTAPEWAAIQSICN